MSSCISVYIIWYSENLKSLSTVLMRLKALDSGFNWLNCSKAVAFGHRPGWSAGPALGLGRGPWASLETIGGWSVLPGQLCVQFLTSFSPLRSRTLKNSRSFQWLQISVTLIPREQISLVSPHSTGVSSGRPKSPGSRRTATGSYTELMGHGREGKLLFCVTQTLVKWPPPSQAMHLRAVSRELDVLLGKWMCVCVSLEDLPAEILIPLLQITKNSCLFSSGV